MALRRAQRQQMILAQPCRPCGKAVCSARQQARPRRQFGGMALAIIEADRFDMIEARQRPGEADGGILAAGKQHKRLRVFVMAALSNAFRRKKHGAGRNCRALAQYERLCRPIPKSSLSDLTAMPFALHPLYVLSGFAVGFLVGMTGVGGGSLMTPLLILLFHVHPVTAVGTDLLYASVTKTGGIAGAWLQPHHRLAHRARLAMGSLPASLLTLLALHLLKIDPAAYERADHQGAGRGAAGDGRWR